MRSARMNDPDTEAAQWAQAECETERFENLSSDPGYAAWLDSFHPEHNQELDNEQHQ